MREPNDRELITQALAQAGVSDPPVRVAALLRIARVQTAFDREEARRTFQQGMDALAELPEEERDELSEPARMVAAAVAPDRLCEIPSHSLFPPSFVADQLVRTMIEHGRVDDAVSYLMRDDEPRSFPFGIVAWVMYKVNDEAVGLALFRRSIEAWRAGLDHPPDPFRPYSFVQLFQAQWKLLPPEEALAVVRDIVRYCLEQPDQQTHATLGEVHITSRREYSLFQILGVLRLLDPALAESLIAAHGQLAAAARRYPNGTETMQEETHVQLFQRQWKLLPPEKALAAVRDIVRDCLAQPDLQVDATLGEAHITSRRESLLFLILGALRRLDPALADSLTASHVQLAAAARRYPNGMDTVQEEAEAERRRSASPEPVGRGYVFIGRPEDLPYSKTVMQASEDGDFGPPMEDALERYAKDTGAPYSNTVAREFWPSTCAYRGILYSAGKRLGAAAAKYLDQIPDADLRLFAKIELAAALAGLPQLQGIQKG